MPKKSNDGEFSCKICFKKFSKLTALGGHTSKAHPGSSDGYKFKIARREERTLERSLLHEAKVLFR